MRSCSGYCCLGCLSGRLSADLDGSFGYARSNESSAKHELGVEFRIRGQVLAIQRAEAFSWLHSSVSKFRSLLQTSEKFWAARLS